MVTAGVVIKNPNLSTTCTAVLVMDDDDDNDVVQCKKLCNLQLWHALLQWVMEDIQWFDASLCDELK